MRRKREQKNCLPEKFQSQPHISWVQSSSLNFFKIQKEIQERRKFERGKQNEIISKEEKLEQRDSNFQNGEKEKEKEGVDTNDFEKNLFEGWDQFEIEKF